MSCTHDLGNECMLSAEIAAEAIEQSRPVAPVEEEAKRALQQSGGELHIADVPPKVMKVLTDLLLTAVLNLHPAESATEVAGQLRRDRIASNGAGPAH